MKTLKTKNAAVIAAAFFLYLIPAAHAQTRRPERMQKDLTPALQKSLEDRLSDEAEPFFNAEDRKKADKQKYVDLQQKFEYLPNYGPRGSLVVSAKMGGVEYDPNKPGSTKGASTGTLKYLVFTYALEKGKWVEIAKPKWETQNLGAAAGRQMTQNQARGDKGMAAQQAAQQARIAKLKAAAEAAQKAEDNTSH